MSNTGKQSERRMVTMVGGFRYDRDLVRLLEQTKRRYDAWFQITLPIPHVAVLTNRRQIDEYWGKPQPTWLVGWYRQNSIYVVDQKVSRRTKAQWRQLVVHEIAHIYINHLSGQQVPRWMNEGLACYLAKQKRVCPPKDIQKYFKKQPLRSPDIYRVGYTVINLLIRRYGRKDILRCLQGLQKTTLKNWQNVFFRVYNITWDRFIRNLYEEA